MNASEPQLEQIRKYLAGESSEQEARLLGDRLQNDPLLRADFLAYARVDAVLANLPALLPSAPPETGEANASPESHVLLVERSGEPKFLAPPALRSPSTPKSPRRTVAAWSAAWAAVLLIGFVIYQTTVIRRPVPFSTLVTSTNARWADPNVEWALRAGELPAGLLRLEEGNVELVTPDRARIFLQAPVAVRFVSRNRIVCEEGRLVCECPTPESRLIVETPQTLVVDLGTVFAVDAQKDASTQVVVLSGEVELRGQRSQRVRGGEVAVVHSSVVRITPVAEEELTRLRAVFAEPELPVDSRRNRLVDRWKPSSELVWVDPNTHSIRISAGDLRQYPMASQTVETGEVSGRTVLASVRAESHPEEPLVDGQYAVLKIAFLDRTGHEFACAFRHFLKPRSSSSAREERVLLAAVAPHGTDAVQIQLLLNTDKRERGSAIFEQPFLSIE
jgi:hypothetical protein